MGGEGFRQLRIFGPDLVPQQRFQLSILADQPIKSLMQTAVFRIKIVS